MFHSSRIGIKSCSEIFNKSVNFRSPQFSLFPLNHGITQKHNIHTSMALRAKFEPTHLDTYLLKKKLVAQGGFSDEQSEIIIDTMVCSLNEGVKHITDDLSSREDLIKLAYRQKVDFTKLRDDLLLLDKNEFNKIDAEQEKLKHDLERMSRRLKEEITKCNAGFKLDISLEKGRIKEEGSLHDLQIKEIDSRIDKEVNNMKIQIDSVKTQVLQWMIGVTSGAFALVLAYIRLVS